MRDQSNVKISAGWCKGLKLKAPKGLDTRPTSMKIRQAVFNMLQSEVEECVFIDFFAGSGAMGIEALSRGARSCYWVENAPAALKALRDNVDAAEKRLDSQDHPPERLRIFAVSFQAALKKLRSEIAADLIWFDPPYQESLQNFRILEKQIADLSRENTVLIVEASVEDTHSFPENFSDTLGCSWNLEKSKSYGGTVILVWRRQRKGPA